MPERFCAMPNCNRPARAFTLTQAYRRPGEMLTRKRHIGAIDLCDRCLPKYARVSKRKEDQ